MKWSKIWRTYRWKKGDEQNLGEHFKRQRPDCRSKYVQMNIIKMDFREVVYDSISGAIKAG
jgi:hypothetical protein